MDEELRITSAFISVAHRDQEIVDLRNMGLTASEIALRIGVTKRTVYRALKRYINAAA